MPLNIANDVIELAGSMANTLRHHVGLVGTLHTKAIAGPIVVLDALKVHESLTSSMRWIQDKAATSGLGAAFGVRFGQAPGDLNAEWAAVRDAGRALANGIYGGLPKAADGTVQIYSAPDATTGERTLLSVTLTGAQRTGFTNLYNAFVATMVLA